MRSYFADLHIHLGATLSGKPVKITASKSMTLTRVLEEAADVKGLDLIGVIDCHVPEVLAELEQLKEKGELVETDQGILCYKDKISLIVGSEIEIYDENCKGPIHILAYIPSINIMKQFSNWLKERITNITLSTQRIYVDGRTLQQQIKDLGGLFIPAHVFTPFKSVYGKGVNKSVSEVFDIDNIDGIELGLSSDTLMASRVRELEYFSFLTNSDAHSLGNIAREYQKMKMDKPSFFELMKALKNEEGREIECNYGLNPLLGKYHETTCERCFEPFNKSFPFCQKCGHGSFIKGVSERIDELADTSSMKIKRKRPPYVHQIPLHFIPTLGPKTLEKLRLYFGTEMNIMHYVSKEQLENVVTKKIAEYIILAREGKLVLQTGGGGKYGKVK
ncbi:TIGR00375 family protein [Anaerobacillus alkaliphilus]|uniref:TIGR00375 family protein n=1 Tax=Anaerobacillus alkaliphilus TaxID=1548597 RepID=A0A4Q0VYW9_9BACI|nr:endonuclease Q family protein [Anaerobacillus alkaliphilus]RXJ03831.1 TIGR00375 family protein [Anaerobacillus alkaliphilus]